MTAAAPVPHLLPHLAALGAHPTPLTAEQLAGLDRAGYVILPGLIDPAWRAALGARLDALVAAEGAAAGSEVHQEEGTARLADLVNKDPLFDRTWSHPVLLAAVHHVLRRPFKLSSLNAREALPGAGLQRLHADWGPRLAVDEPWHVVNSLWLLDDYAGDNGCTRLVPGSHRLAGGIDPAYHDPARAHPDEVVLRAPAGSVVVLNAHTWHGGTRNVAGARRRVVHAYFTAREHPQQTDQRRHLRPETAARLSAAQRWLLDA